MTSRVERQAEAYERALELCRIHGLPKNHIVPRYGRMKRRWWFGKSRKRKHIIGYYVIDDTKSTTIAIVDL